ncbi:MAG TPA: MBL fold metallo-hydrolase [Nevskiaceae bacterium]|nr:MBL fold metallo-hydrolase [Nevskiaceae bacterium]
MRDRPPRLAPVLRPLLLASGLLAGCGQSAPPAASLGGPLPSCAADYIAPYTPDWTPLPAAARLTLDAETQALRDRLLGPGATDPEQVKVWWVGVASFIMTLRGHLFLLDAWEIVGLHADYLPLGREELAALKPEAILIGHGHFDHAGDVGYVAGRSGAVVVGGEATCATAREQAARDGLENAFPCLLLGNAETPAPGTLQQIQLWEDVEPVTVLRHTHSNADPADLTAGGLPLIFVPDLLTYLLFLNTDPQEVQWFAESLDDESGNSPEGGTWAYHFKAGDFTLLWHDSAGPIASGKPFAEAIQCALDAFPGCVDVQLGTIVGFGAVTSGLRDVSLYLRHARPKVSLPNHHDAWAPIVGPGDEAYEAQWRAEVASLPFAPELDYLKDPEDYLRVRSFHLADPRWIAPTPGSSCAGG